MPFWKFGGAMQRVAPDATGFGDRSAPFMLSLDAIWSNAKDDEANISWVRNSWNHMQRHSTGRLYLNFPGLGEDPSLVKKALGENVFTRLQQVKRKYDPENFFHLNQNVPPR
jgi:FAD/FMN-containing dehydrogenase